MGIAHMELTLRISDVFGELEQRTSEKVDHKFSNLVKEINESFSGLLQSVVKNAEELERSLKQDIKEQKRNLLDHNIYEWYGSNNNNIKIEKLEKNSVFRQEVQNLENRKNAQESRSKATMKEMGKVSKYSETLITYSENDLVNPLEIKNESCNENIFPNASNDLVSRLSLQGKKSGKIIKDENNLFHCNQCKYSTTENRYVTRHIMTVHNKIKNYECEECGKEFGLKHHLKNHMDTKHSKLY